jgi:hypothetical protein
MPPLASAMGVLVGTLPEDVRFRASTDTGVPFKAARVFAADLRTVLAPSSRTESSSGASSASSRMGDTVPTTRLLFSMERTSSSRSGLSSSSSPSSVPGCASVEPRFLLPSCGVRFGVRLRFELPLRWTDALRCRCAEPFARRGVVRTGVRREDGCGGREDCFAAPKLKPKDACTADGLGESVHGRVYPGI